MEYTETTKIELNKDKTYYFIGIGGISMSALAKILIDRGFKIAGSDTTKTEITKFFEDKGYEINYKQVSENIKNDYTIVYTDAIIKDTNGEYQEALKMGLDIIPRASLLSHLAKEKKTSVAISGTHGKTTTTTMLSHILIECGLDPMCLVGGIVPKWNSNLKEGQGNLFVYEACEAFNNLKYYSPHYLIVTSIDADHLDNFGTIENIKKDFTSLINKVAQTGFVLLNIDDEITFELKDKFKGNIHYYSINVEKAKKQNIKLLSYAKNISFKDGYTEFELHIGANKSFIHLPLYGLHNVQNFVSAVSIASFFEKDIEKLSKSIESFVNAKRRFEFVGKFNGANVYNDYSHHPREIDSMMNIAKTVSSQKNGRIIVVFQPHLFSRTKEFYKEFAKSLSKADEILLMPIYPAREEPIAGVSSELILNELVKLNANSYLCIDWDKTKDKLQSIVRKDDIIITVGAGNIGDFYKKIID